MKGIPAISARMDGGEVLVGPLSFQDALPKPPGGRLGFTQFQSGFARRQPILVFDAAGFAEGTLDAGMLKELIARGKELWVCTPVHDVDDLFDAFSTGLDYLLVPTHLVRGREDLLDMLDVSDRVIPAIFAMGAKALDGESLESALNRVSALGFDLVALFDTDGAIPGSLWKRLLSLGPGIVPYAPGRWDWGTNASFQDSFRSIP